MWRKRERCVQNQADYMFCNAWTLFNFARYLCWGCESRSLPLFSHPFVIQSHNPWETWADIKTNRNRHFIGKILYLISNKLVKPCWGEISGISWTLYTYGWSEWKCVSSTPNGISQRNGFYLACNPTHRWATIHSIYLFIFYMKSHNHF